MPNSEYKHTSTREKFFSCEVAFSWFSLIFFIFFMTFHLVQRGGAVRIGPCWTTQWRERSKAAWVWSERSGDGGGGSSSVRTAAERGVKGWPGKGRGGACCWLAGWVTGWVTGWVVQLWTYSCPDSLSPTPSVCSKRGLLQAKVGPVDWQPLTGLSGRIQTKPAEEEGNILGRRKLQLPAPQSHSLCEI